jgi:AcrR family transcriptional regulator
MRNRAGVETAERIVAATRTLLAEVGLEGTTVKAICDAAGVRAGSFYNLFESKEEVVLTVIREAIQAVDPHPGHTETDTVADLVEAYIRFVTGENILARVYMAVAVSGAVTDGAIRTRVLRHHQARLDRFAAAFRRDRPDLDEAAGRDLMEAMLAALNGYTLQRMLDPNFDFAGHARRLLTMEPA